MLTQKVDPIEYLKSTHKDARYMYMPNGGNLGDGLIAAATIQAFAKAGLNWQFMRGGDVSIYGGGGSLIEMYQGGYDCLKFLHAIGKPVIILPHTIRGNADFWKSLPKTTVFCREPISYEFMQSFEQHEVFLADDMALSLNVHTPPYQVVVDYRDKLKQSARTQGAVTAFRQDNESSAPGKATEIDFSQLASPSMQSETDIVAHTVAFLTMIAPFDKVATDRLHVAIACALLGVHCDCYDNSYGKLSAVFEFSLQGRYSNITWRDN